MPVDISCPSCGKKLRVQEKSLGQKIKCPNCKNVFASSPTSKPEPALTRGKTAPLEAVPEPMLTRDKGSPAEDMPEVLPAGTRPPRVREEEARAERRPARSRPLRRSSFEEEAGTAGPVAPGWDSVRRGLTALNNSILIVAGSVVLLIATFLGLATMQLDPDHMVAIKWVVSMVGYAALAGMLATALALIGQGLCCAVPETAGRARRAAVASLVWLVLLPVIVVVAGGVGDWAVNYYRSQELTFGTNQYNKWHWYIWPLAVCVGQFFFFWGHMQFVSFLRNVGQAFENRRLLTSSAVYVVFITLLELTFLALAAYALYEDYGTPMSKKPFASGRDEHIFLPAFQEITDLMVYGAGLGLLLLWLVLVVWFLGLLGRARGSIRKAQRLAAEAAGEE